MISRPDRLIDWLMVPLSGLAAVWAGASLWWPFGTDQSWLGWVADAIRSGKIPYRDIWDNNSPGGPIQQALLQSVFGPAEWPLRVLDLLYLSLGCAALVALGTRLHSRRAGLLACLLLVLNYAAMGSNATAQRDGFGTMSVLVALALAGATAPAYAVLSGALVSWAALMKPPLALLLLPIAVMAIETPHPEGRRRRGLRIALLLTGFAVPLAACTLWLYQTDALREAYRCVYVFNAVPYRVTMAGLGQGAGLLAGMRHNTARSLVGWSPLLALACVGVWYLLKVRPRGRWSVALLPLVGAAIVVWQGRFLGYHLNALFAPASLLAGLGAAHLASPAYGRRPASRFLLPVLGLLVAGALFQPCRGTVGRLREAIPLITGRGGPSPALTDTLATREAGRYLMEHTRPGEAFQLWGSQAGLYFFAQRPSATRFGYTWPIAYTGQTLPALQREYTAEFLRELASARPRYFVLSTREADAFAAVPQVKSYVEENYREETKIRFLSILRLADRTAP